MHIRRSMATAVLFLSVTAAMADELVTVTQKSLAFTPNELSLTKGQTVEFVNNDSTAHNVMIMGDGVNFNGGLQPPGGHVRYTFAKAGSFMVGCGIHPKMKITIIVK